MLPTRESGRFVWTLQNYGGGGKGNVELRFLVPPSNGKFTIRCKEFFISDRSVDLQVYVKMNWPTRNQEVFVLGPVHT